MGPGRPVHPGHPAGRPNEAWQVASQLEAARPKKADEAAGMEQAAVLTPQTSEHNIVIPWRVEITFFYIIFFFILLGQN